ncbi:MAG: hypothetical protein IPL02_03670 [Moraxellaceae bacterium]|nr:hypothetical protein [Moraxellaceae bacterium]
MAKTLEGDIAGFFLVYPDYSELVSPQNPHAINPNDIRYELHYPCYNNRVLLWPKPSVWPSHIVPLIYLLP